MGARPDSSKGLYRFPRPCPIKDPKTETHRADKRCSQRGFTLTPKSQAPQEWRGVIFIYSTILRYSTELSSSRHNCHHVGIWFRRDAPPRLSIPHT